MKEVVLSQIKLKYFQSKPSPGQKPIVQEKSCYFCKKKFEKIGTVLDAYSNKPKFACEDCAIMMFKYQEGFKTKKAAAARRRRMFDVNYLFQEMAMDLYLEKNNLKIIEDLSEEVFEGIAEQCKDTYNSFYTKEDKIKIEELSTQEEIEKELKKALAFINI